MLKTTSDAIAFSELDSSRFGIRVARALITAGNLSEVLADCKDQNIELLITRCATGELAAVQAAEAEGFLLTDTLLYYKFDTKKQHIPEVANPLHVRPLRAGDEDQVRQIAAAAFKSYMGHYHADPRLDRASCDDAYTSWAERSCVPGAADRVLVAECDGRIAGFGTLRLNSRDEVEGLLFAVAPDFQGRGICGSLMVGCLEWTRTQGASRMIISTQVTNISMQKVWCRVGFVPSHSFYTLHRWFER